MSEVTTPAGIPSIPEGDRLDTRGAENQAPTNPIQPQDVPQGQHPQVQPTDKPTEPPAQEIPENPIKEDSKPVLQSTSYVSTAIEHLSGELGVSADDFDAVYANAIKHNDPSLINPDALGKQLTPEQKVRVQQLAELSVQEFTQGVERAKQEAYTVAGGEAQWTTAVQAFNANADADQKGYAGYLADNGKLKECAQYVMKITREGGHINQENQTPLQGGNGSPLTGLSKAEYTAELGKLERTIGNRSFESPEYKAKLDDLNARRTLGRQQGR